jgi:SAM-dependent methyltransferase
VIATGYSGPLDYLSGDAHHLVRHTLSEVRQAYAYYRPTMRWAEPDTGHASQLLRAVRANPDEARKRAGAVVQQLRDVFSLEAIGQRARRRLIELLHRTDPVKWGRLDRMEHPLLSSRPPVPIPGEWYDADYFEHGRKSNWKNGYHWRDFAGLFSDTAEFLTTTFTEANSFLDAGCAKGFLVRALRERQREAWGFDHSAWALDRAEEPARPFLYQASAENAEFDRSFDLTLAFSLLESLTEEQALAFLQRAGAWTRQAFVAVICTCEDDQRKRLADEDHDLAHITLRSRAWWHDLFLRAGWKQDGLHRVAERVCRTHPLPKKMGWQVLVYAP